MSLKSVELLSALSTYHHPTPLHTPISTYLQGGGHHEQVEEREGRGGWLHTVITFC